MNQSKPGKGRATLKIVQGPWKRRSHNSIVGGERVAFPRRSLRSYCLHQLKCISKPYLQMDEVKPPYMLFYMEPSSRSSSKGFLFLDLFLSNANIKSSLIVP